MQICKTEHTSKQNRLKFINIKTLWISISDGDAVVGANDGTININCDKQECIEKNIV